MKALYAWKEMLKNLCLQLGWEDNKNCGIEYIAQADTKKDILTFSAKVYPFDRIEEIEIKAVLD